MFDEYGEGVKRNNKRFWMFATIGLGVAASIFVIIVLSGQSTIGIDRNVLPVPSGLIGFLVLMFLGIIAGILYFMPTAIAVVRKHHNMVSIMVLNLFAGWTYLGWVTALVWSVSNQSPAQRVIIETQMPKRV